MPLGSRKISRYRQRLNGWHQQTNDLPVCRPCPVGTFSLTRAMFTGTAILYSSLAEKDGGKGCRIFVHKKSSKVFLESQPPVRVLALPALNGTADIELCYLQSDESSLQPGEALGDNDLDLWKAVRAMQRANEPMPSDVAIQYTDTLTALNRMRHALGRPAFEW